MNNWLSQCTAVLCCVYILSIAHVTCSIWKDQFDAVCESSSLYMLIIFLFIVSVRSAAIQHHVSSLSAIYNVVYCVRRNDWQINTQKQRQFRNLTNTYYELTAYIRRGCEWLIWKWGSWHRPYWTHLGKGLRNLVDYWYSIFVFLFILSLFFSVKYRDIFLFIFYLYCLYSYLAHLKLCPWCWANGRLKPEQQQRATVDNINQKQHTESSNSSRQKLSAIKDKKL